MIAERHRLHPLREPDGDARGPRALGEKLDEIGAVDEAELRPRPAAGKVEPEDAPARLAVEKLDRLGRLRAGGEGRAQPERFQHAGPVGRDLQAGADLGYLRRLFQHRHGKAALRQGAGGGQAGDAGADDGDGKRAQRRTSAPAMARNSSSLSCGRPAARSTSAAKVAGAVPGAVITPPSATACGTSR